MAMSALITKFVSNVTTRLNAARKQLQPTIPGSNKIHPAPQIVLTDLDLYIRVLVGDYLSSIKRRAEPAQFKAVSSFVESMREKFDTLKAAAEEEDCGCSSNDVDLVGSIDSYVSEIQEMADDLITRISSNGSRKRKGSIVI